jgi:hypothetical protein
MTSKKANRSKAAVSFLIVLPQTGRIHLILLSKTGLPCQPHGTELKVAFNFLYYSTKQSVCLYPNRKKSAGFEKSFRQVYPTGSLSKINSS